MLEQSLRKVGANLNLVRSAWVQALNDKKLEDFAKYHSDNVIMYDPTMREPLKGRVAIRDWAQTLYGMFPDYAVKELRLFGQDEWVCLEVEESGTMRGAMHGPGGMIVPATNKHFKTTSSIVFRVEDEKISEVRVYYDVLGLMAQLGLGPR